MANNADTTFVIEGPKEEIFALHEKLAYCKNRDTKEFKEFLKAHNNRAYAGEFRYVAKVLNLDVSQLYIRGEIYELDDIDENGKVFNFSTISAWDAPVDFVARLLKKYAPHCEMYYKSEEPGTGYYLIHDDNGKYFPEDFVVDIDVCRHAKDYKDFALSLQDMNYYTEEELASILKEGFHTVISSIDVLLDMLELKNKETLDEDEFIRVGRFKRI